MKRIKTLSLILLATILYAVSIMLSGCAVYLDVFKENYTEWYAKNGICGFTATLVNNGAEAYGYVTVNGIKVRALFEVSPTATINVKLQYSEELGLPKGVGNITYYYKDDFYGEIYAGKMSGYHDGDIFCVDSFTVGAMELGPFKMYNRTIEPFTVDARDYTECVWTSDDGDIFINYISIAMDVHFGSITVDGEDIPIHFKWCDGNRFEIYNGEDGATERSVLASGTYSNVATDLSLTFEEDTFFDLQGQTVNLTGTVS